MEARVGPYVPKISGRKEWEQVAATNFRSPGLCHRVDPVWFADPDSLI